MDERPIGVFDSGFGGLTVARALLDLLPSEQIIYVGDTARYPYGNKPLEDVRDYAFRITRWLIEEHDVKLVVVACNTASAAALDLLEAAFPVPIIGVIEPGATSLAQATLTGRAGVIGTVGTIKSGAYQAALTAIDPNLELTCCACPGFVEFVERGELLTDEVRVLARRLLAPITESEADALLLGCTHYPFLARTISDVLGPDVMLVSSADETAFAVLRTLTETGARNSGPVEPPVFLSSGDVGTFERIGRMLLGPEMVDVLPWIEEESV